MHLQQQLELELKNPLKTVDQTALCCTVEKKKKQTTEKALSLNQDYCAYPFVFIGLNLHFVARLPGTLSCRKMTANTSGKFVHKLPLGKLLFPPEKKKKNKKVKLLIAWDVADMR